MIVDTSAIVAVLRSEEDSSRYSSLIAASASVSMSAANYVELGAVIDGRRDPALSAQVDALLAEFSIEIAPVTLSQARIARQAYRDFGKGSGHPAQLNFGDCFAYALAMDRGEPLLYKGDDFAAAGLERLV